MYLSPILDSAVTLFHFIYSTSFPTLDSAVTLFRLQIPDSVLDI